ncbi:MAG: DUF3849 domain-containing protein [Lachnospiraceae bacterium]|nr:DUF3849 domain-containing protein [Lachnospiraceae bacterium]
MNRYDFLIYESRQGEASIEAESPKEARDKLMALYKAGGIEFTFVTGTDNEILNITPLKAAPLQRFEIFGREALFTDLPTDKVDALQGADKLYRYDLPHGDDDSIPLKVQLEVTVNRYGTVFTTEPLFMEGEFSRDLYDEDWGFISDEPPMTPEQFYNATQEKERQTVREYEIYQLNAGGRDQMFMNMKELRAMRVTPNIASYDSVYKGTLEPGMTLDSLYTKFNVERPEDFKGHSLSVSDVIVVNDEHGKTAWFVDSIGFTQLPEFFIAQEQQHDVPAEGEKTYPPVYRHSADYAREAGERDEYRASLQENTRCKAAIEKAVKMHYDGMYLHENAISAVLDVFGPERLSWVLGNTITMKEHDGRFSRSNKAWAQAMSIPIDRDGFGSLRNWSYTVESHPAILDLYTTLLRKELERPPQERAAEKPVAREESKPRQEAKQEPSKSAKRKSEPSL